MKKMLLKELVNRAKGGDALAMDHASRMARAKEGGYNIKMYRGQVGDVADLPPHQATSYESPSFSSRPDFASGYAENPTAAHSKYTAFGDIPDTTGANVAEYLARGDVLDATKYQNAPRTETGMTVADIKSLADDLGIDGDELVKELDGKYVQGSRMEWDDYSGEWDSNYDTQYSPLAAMDDRELSQLQTPAFEVFDLPDVQAAIKAKGYDGVSHKGSMSVGQQAYDNPSISPNPLNESMVDVETRIFDPSNIRSTNAAFDPSKKDSSNLLASGLAGTAIAGGLGSQEAEAGVGKLAMDAASRIQRAKDQGFDTTRRVYHGTAEDFESFDPDRAIGTQFWSTTDKAAIEAGEVGAQGKGYIKEMFTNIKNPAGWDEYDRLGIDEIRGRGYDGIELKEGDESTFIAFKPNQYRDTNAAFDPSKKDSSNLLASAAPAAVGLGALMGGEEAEAGLVGEALGQAKRIPDLMQPFGKSKMVGNEKLVLDTPDLKIFEADPDYVPRGAGKSYRYVKYQDGQPVSVLQFAKDGPRSKSATIQNVETIDDSRRQGHAKELLERARQDFDVKHSDDLTDKGRAWSKAVPSVAGAVGLGALYTPEQNTAQAYNPSTDQSKLSTGYNNDRPQDYRRALAQLAATDKSMERYPEPKYNPLAGDYGSIEADEYPYLQQAGDFIEKWTQTPLGGSPVEGLAEYLRGFGNDADTQEKASRAFWAALDLMP